MIIVLADDFSGAAEIAGIALRFGLDTELQTEAGRVTNADVLVIDTDTRSCSEKEAVIKIKQTLSNLKQMNPAWIYKKTDSVLRGHVLAEISETMKALDYKMCLLLPENPGKSRTVSNGQYFINGELLNRTVFLNDPEYPAMTADVLKLLGESVEIPTSIKKPDQQLSSEGICVCEAENSHDVKIWTEKWQENMLAAGGAEFFAGLLFKQGLKVEKQSDLTDLVRDKTALCIWGSSVKNDDQVYEEFKNAGFQIIEIPISSQISNTEHIISETTRLLLEKLKKGQIVLSFTSEQNLRFDFLTNVTAKIVENILQTRTIDELLIEGGSTASTIVRKMGWDRFIPTDELLPGVVRLLVANHPGLYITVKPGSYPWPEEFI